MTFQQAVAQARNPGHPLDTLRVTHPCNSHYAVKLTFYRKRSGAVYGFAYPQFNTIGPGGRWMDVETSFWAEAMPTFRKHFVFEGHTGGMLAAQRYFNMIDHLLKDQVR